MDRRLHRHAPLAVALLAVLAGLWVRLHRLTANPLWLDEAYSAYAAGKGWAFLWRVVPTYETHPPFYYSLLRLWTLVAGDGLGAHRALGAVAGLATLPVLALIAREAGRTLEWEAARTRWAMVAAVALGALAPPLVEMAREVRPYPVLILVYATGLYAVLRVGRIAGATGRLEGRGFALYALVQALLLWLHTLGPLYAASLGLGLTVQLIGRQIGKAGRRRFVLGHVAVVLVYLPAFLIMLDQAPTWVRSTWLRFSWTMMDVKLAWLWAGIRPAARIAAAGLAALALWRLARGDAGRRIAAALLLAAILPVALSLLISASVTPVFILRTMTACAVPSLMLLALGAAGQRGWLRPVAAACAVLFAWQLGAADLRARAAPAPYAYYDAVRWLAARFRPGDEVWAYPNEGALPLRYAMRDLGVAMPVRALPVEVPAIGVGGWNPTGSRGVVSLPRARLRVLAKSGGDVPTVWLYRLGPRTYDRGDMFRQELSRGRAVVGRFRREPIDIIGLRIPRDLTPGAGPQ